MFGGRNLNCFLIARLIRAANPKFLCCCLDCHRYVATVFKFTEDAETVVGMTIVQCVICGVVIAAFRFIENHHAGRRTAGSDEAIIAIALVTASLQHVPQRNLLIPLVYHIVLAGSASGALNTGSLSTLQLLTSQ